MDIMVISFVFNALLLKNYSLVKLVKIDLLVTEDVAIYHFKQVWC